MAWVSSGHARDGDEGLELRGMVQAPGALGDVLGVVADPLEVVGDLERHRDDARGRPPSAGAVPASLMACWSIASSKRSTILVALDDLQRQILVAVDQGLDRMAICCSA
jgi:hypothetical protein